MIIGSSLLAPTAGNHQVHTALAPRSLSAHFSSPVNTALQLTKPGLGMLPRNANFGAPSAGDAPGLGNLLGLPSNPLANAAGPGSVLARCDQTTASQNATQGVNSQFTAIAGKVFSIAEKLKTLKALNIPGLSDCIGLVDGVAGALDAGAKGDFTSCAKKLLEAGSAALSLAKHMGRLGIKVAGRSLPVASLVLSEWGRHESGQNAERARAKGNGGSAALWEAKGACDAAAGVMSALQLVAGGTVVMPAGLEGGILVLSLVSELLAEAGEKDTGTDARPNPGFQTDVSVAPRAPRQADPRRFFEAKSEDPIFRLGQTSQK